MHCQSCLLTDYKLDFWFCLMFDDISHLYCFLWDTFVIMHEKHEIVEECQESLILKLCIYLGLFLKQFVQDSDWPLEQHWHRKCIM